MNNRLRFPWSVRGGMIDAINRLIRDAAKHGPMKLTILVILCNPYLFWPVFGGWLTWKVGRLIQSNYERSRHEPFTTNEN